MKRREKCHQPLKAQTELHFCVGVVTKLALHVFLCVYGECYAVLHLPVVEMEGDMAGCSLSEEGEC